MAVGKTLIVIPCCERKEPDRKDNTLWRAEVSAAAQLTPERAHCLLDCRRELGRLFRYKPGPDLGGEGASGVSLMPAYRRYRGNLYGRIDWRLWERIVDAKAAEIVIVSALYGLVTPWEAIRDYDLSMTSSIGSRRRLARWWSEHGLGAILAEYVQRSGASTVENFLTIEYSRSVEHAYSLKPGPVPLPRAYGEYRSGANYYRGEDIANLLKRLVG